MYQHLSDCVLITCCLLMHWRWNRLPARFGMLQNSNSHFISFAQYTVQHTPISFHTFQAFPCIQCFGSHFLPCLHLAELNMYLCVLSKIEPLCSIAKNPGPQKIKNFLCPWYQANICKEHRSTHRKMILFHNWWLTLHYFACDLRKKLAKADASLSRKMFWKRIFLSSCWKVESFKQAKIKHWSPLKTHL